MNFKFESSLKEAAFNYGRVSRTEIRSESKFNSIKLKYLRSIKIRKTGTHTWQIGVRL